MFTPLADNYKTSCRHPVCVSSLDQSMFVSVETFRAHSLCMMCQGICQIRTMQHGSGAIVPQAWASRQLTTEAILIIKIFASASEST